MSAQDCRYRDLATAFWDRKLEARDRARFQEHLSECRTCREEVQQVKMAMEAASTLARRSAPPGLWDEIERHIDPQSQPRRANYPIYAGVAALLLAVLSVLFLTLVDRTDDSSWTVAATEGVPSIAGRRAAVADRLLPGELLETGSGSRVRLEQSDVGQVEIEAGSRVRVLSAGADYRLGLEMGSLYARIWAPPRTFFVRTPSVQVVDLGCAYRIETRTDGNGMISVFSGLVGLPAESVDAPRSRYRSEVLVPEGASCRLTVDGPGIPFMRDSSPAFQNALQRWEDGEIAALQTILGESRAADALSLIYLLQDERAEATKKRLLELRPGLAGSEDLLAAVLQPTDEDSANGQLEPAASMGQPRFGHTASRLADGRVLIAGGVERNGGLALASTELFDPTANRFFPGDPMQTPRSDHTATVLEDRRVLLAGGNNWPEQRCLQSSEIFDPTSGEFRPSESLIEARSGHEATLLPDGRVLISGGSDCFGQPLSSLEIYDPASGRFQTAATMLSSRTGHSVTPLDAERVLIAGGEFAGDVSAEVYDLSSGSSEATGPMQSARYKHADIRLEDGTVLLIGGRDPGAGRTLSSVEKFDPETLEFSPYPSLNQPRYKIAESTARLSDGRLLIAGGSRGVEIFDPVKRTFALLRPSMDGPRFYATAVSLKDGRVLIAGGYQAGIRATSDAWIFTPVRREK